MRRFNFGSQARFWICATEKRQLKRQKYTSTEAGLECRKVNREVRKKMKAAKEEWSEAQCKNTEKGIIYQETAKEVYNTLKALIKIQQQKSAVIEDSSGNILTESTAVLSRWTEYRSDLYNYKLHPDTSLLKNNQTPTQRG